MARSWSGNGTGRRIDAPRDVSLYNVLGDNLRASILVEMSSGENLERFLPFYQMLGHWSKEVSCVGICSKAYGDHGNTR